MNPNPNPETNPSESQATNPGSGQVPPQTAAVVTPTLPSVRFRVAAKVDKNFEFFKIVLDDKMCGGQVERPKDRWGYDTPIYLNAGDDYNSVVTLLGRTHSRNGGDITYPLIPTFLKFAFAVGVNHNNRSETEKIPIYTDEIVSVETLVNMLSTKVRTGLMEKFNSWSVERDLAMTENVEKDDLQFPSDLLPTLIDECDRAAKVILQMKLRDVQAKGRIKKRTKQYEEKTHEVPHSSYLFKNGIEIHFDGDAALFMQRLQPTLDILREKTDKIRRWRTEGVPPEERTYELRGKYEPMDHQWVMWKVHTLLESSVDFSQMGTGKTFGMSMTIDTLIKEGKVRPGHILAIMPATLLPNWEKELGLHTPHLTYEVLEGSFNYRMSRLMLPDNEKPTIFGTNYEAFTMKATMEISGGGSKTLPLAKVFGLCEWDMVILDEGHKIKNPDAQRTAAILDAFKEVPYKKVMSGTINANKLHDIHAPLVFLNRARQFNLRQIARNAEPGPKPYTLGELRGQFLEAYFSRDGANFTPRSYAISEFRELMEQIGVRFEKAECMTLPPKMYEVRQVEMSSQQTLLYNALKNKLITELMDRIDEGGTVTVTNILAMMVKLAEAANGWIKNDNGVLIDLPWNPKLDALMEIVEDIGENDKIVIWSRFTHDLHLISDKLKAEYGAETVEVLHGGVHCSICGASKDDRFASTKRFNDMESPVRFMIANPAAGGHGIDLTGATFEIFYSNSFVKTDRAQAEDRCHRKGMREKLTILDIVAKDTIDVEVLAAMRSWKSVSRALLTHLGIPTDKLPKEQVHIGDGNDEPVITEHKFKQPLEYVLKAMALMNCIREDITVEDIIAWMKTNITANDNVKFESEDIKKAADHFCRWSIADQLTRITKGEMVEVNHDTVKVNLPNFGVLILRIGINGDSKYLPVLIKENFVYDTRYSSEEGMPVEQTEWLRKMEESGNEKIVWAVE